MLPSPETKRSFSPALKLTASVSNSAYSLMIHTRRGHDVERGGVDRECRGADRRGDAGAATVTREEVLRYANSNDLHTAAI